MPQIFATHPYLVLIAALLLGTGLVLLLRRRKARREQREMSQFKRQDEALNEALRNPQLEENRDRPEGPMSVSWGDRAVSRRKAPPSPMVELVLLSEYSHRTYIYRLDQPIRIGSERDNHMELHLDGVVSRHLELFLNQGKPCVRTLPGARAVLKRGRTAAAIPKDGVYLNSGDHIQFGRAELQFRLFKG